MSTFPTEGANSVGFLGVGEVATTLSAAPAARGVPVFGYDINLDRTPAEAERVHRRVAGRPIALLSLPDLVERSAVLFSTVGPAKALECARTCAALLSPDHLYVDLNSVSPDSKARIAETIRAAGARFGEAAILDSVDVAGVDAHIVLAGPDGGSAALEVRRIGLSAVFLGPEPGKAAMFKMLRSVFSKGMECLTIEMLLSARKAGLQEELWLEVLRICSGTTFKETVSTWVGSHLRACKRRHAEMSEALAALREMGLRPIITPATTAFLERSEEQANADAATVASVPTGDGIADIKGLAADLVRPEKALR